MALTHNRRNIFADGCMEPSPGGLSIRGQSIVKEISILNMILDLVHISEPSFFDVLEIYRKPFIVSHSNVKAICNHQRNLNDEQIIKVGEKNGVIGVTAVGMFIDENVKKAMVVGHNPALTDLANTIGDTAISNIPTSGVCCVELDISSWAKFGDQCGKLKFFEFPKKQIS